MSVLAATSNQMIGKCLHIMNIVSLFRQEVFDLNSFSI